MTTFEKDPGELLDYQRDWTDHLDAAETVATSEWDVPGGLALSASSKTDKTATVWLEGGQANTTYRVRNTISTSESRVLVRSFLIRVLER